MKRKIFSKLLMVALVIAAMSSFVSCKDYDDDINNLQKQIDAAALKTQVASLESALQTAQQNITTAQAAADAAKAAAEKAQQTGNTAEQHAQEGIAAAQAAAAAAETAKAEAIAEAISKVEALATQIAEGYVTEEDFNAAVAKLATVEALNAAVEKLYSKEKGEDLEAKVAQLITDVAAIDPKLIALGAKDTELAGLIGTNKAAIADNAVAIKQLQTQMKADSLALEAFKTLAGQTYATKTAVNQAVAAALATANTRIDSLKNAINTALEAYAKKTDLDAYAKKVSVDSLKARMQNAEQAIQGLAGLDSTQIKAIVAGLGAKVDTTAFNAIKTQLTQASGNLSTLTLYIDKLLNSLVTIPNFYYGGIEAIEAPMLTYQALTYTADYLKALDEKFEDADGKAYTNKLKGQNWTKENGYNLTAGTTARNLAADVKKYTVDIMRAVEAEYHVNPATLSASDIEKVEIISADKDYYTRAAKANPTASGFDVANGIMTVNIDLDWNKISTNKVTVLATQATGAKKDSEGNDRVVTSDYAAVLKSFITELVIADNAADGEYADEANERYDNYDCKYPTAAEPQAAHVYTTIDAAIQNDATHSIYWNSEPIDLNDIIEVHAKRFILDGHNSPDDGKEFDLTSQLAKYGLQLKYTLISYIDGTEKTEQTLTHSTLEGSIFTVKSIKEDGSQNKSAIGRKPLVRIELIDTNNNNAIAAIGYIKFVITATPVTDQEIVIPVKETTAYKICAGFDDKITWADVEGKILANDNLAEEGISKTTFEASYRFAVVDDQDKEDKISGTPLNLWTANTQDKVATYIWNGSKFELKPAYQNVISYTTTDGEQQQTNVLKLNVSYDLAWYLLAKKNPNYNPAGTGNALKEFLNAAGQPTNNLKDAALEESVDVTLAAKLIGSDGLPNVYVTWDVTISQLALALNKIPEYWYAANNEVAKSGVHEIHVNVNPVGQAEAAIKNFKGDLRKTLVNTTINNATNEPITLAAKIADPAKGLVPATGMTIDDATRAKFVGNLLVRLGFVGGTDKLKIGDVEKTGDFVTGSSNQKYFMYPSADSTKIFAIPVKAADNKPMALADAGVDAAAVWPTENEYTNGLIVTLSNNEFKLNGDDQETLFDEDGVTPLPKYFMVMDILNYIGEKDLSKTLTAHVKAVVREVNEEAECDNPVLLENPDFDVKFLRPLNAAGGDDAEFTDAIDKGNILYMMNLAEFKDWRAQWTNGTYHNFYEVKSIVPDTKEITTTLNNGTLGTTKLVDVAPNTKFYYYLWNTANAETNKKGKELKDAEDKNIYDRSKSTIGYNKDNEEAGTDLGALYYPNIDVNVGNFKVRVPMEVTYHWGILRGVNVDIDVKFTKNNGGSGE